MQQYLVAYTVFYPCPATSWLGIGTRPGAQSKLPLTLSGIGIQWIQRNQYPSQVFRMRACGDIDEG